MTVDLIWVNSVETIRQLAGLRHTNSASCYMKTEQTVSFHLLTFRLQLEINGVPKHWQLMSATLSLPLYRCLSYSWYVPSRRFYSLFVYLYKINAFLFLTKIIYNNLSALYFDSILLTLQNERVQKHPHPIV